MPHFPSRWQDIVKQQINHAGWFFSQHRQYLNTTDRKRQAAKRDLDLKEQPSVPFWRSGWNTAYLSAWSLLFFFFFFFSFLILSDFIAGSNVTGYVCVCPQRLACAGQEQVTLSGNGDGEWSRLWSAEVSSSLAVICPAGKRRAGAPAAQLRLHLRTLGSAF